MVTATLIDVAWAAAASVEDPELPFVTIEDLGVLRRVEPDGDVGVVVTLTPTYTGCPATEVIQDAVFAAVTAAGFDPVRVVTELSPAWTTDDITPEGRRKLDQGGIAPPGEPILCPQCRSSSTRLIAEFGSTACKALRTCGRCGEPFDHFKELR